MSYSAGSIPAGAAEAGLAVTGEAIGTAGAGRRLAAVP
jgi:hypothetical protein